LEDALGFTLLPAPLSTVGILLIFARVSKPPVTVPTIEYCGVAGLKSLKKMRNWLPFEPIVPYVRQPENVIPGRPMFYATASTLGGYASPILVESHLGRPTKVEGNDQHPASLGGTDIFAQASILEMYDPDRSQTITYLLPQVTYVVANFKETQVGRMHPGQDAEVVVDAFPGRSFHAKVESIAFGTGAQFSMLPPDNASGNFVKVVQRVPVKIVWDPDQDTSQLHAGISVEVDVHLQH